VKSNMFLKGSTKAVPEGHRRARAKLAERHAARAGAITFPTHSPASRRPRRCPRPHLCLRLWFCSCCWLLAAGCGWRLLLLLLLLPATCCLLPAVCCLRLLYAACCLLSAPVPASADCAQNGTWKETRPSKMSLRQLRTRAAVPFGHRIGASL